MGRKSAIFVQQHSNMTILSIGDLHICKKSSTFVADFEK